MASVRNPQLSCIKPELRARVGGGQPEKSRFSTMDIACGSAFTLSGSRNPFALTEVEKMRIERDDQRNFLNYLTMRGKLA
jgi:hypothetical protein